MEETNVAPLPPQGQPSPTPIRVAPVPQQDPTLYGLMQLVLLDPNTNTQDKKQLIDELRNWLLRCVSSARAHAAFRIGTPAIYPFSMSYQASLLTT